MATAIIIMILLLIILIIIISKYAIALYYISALLQYSIVQIYYAEDRVKTWFSIRRTKVS